MRGGSALRHENCSRFREAALHFPCFLQARIRQIAALMPGAKTPHSLSKVEARRIWHNGVRSRLHMHSTTAAEGEQPDNDLREIEFLKNQYGPREQRIVLRYKDGLYLPVAGMSSLERAAHEQRIDNVFLSCLRKREELNWPVMPGRTSRDYAPKVFARLWRKTRLTPRKITNKRWSGC